MEDLGNGPNTVTPGAAERSVVATKKVAKHNNLGCVAEYIGQASKFLVAL
jgi:hypothetical protein